MFQLQWDCLWRCFRSHGEIDGLHSGEKEKDGHGSHPPGGCNLTVSIGPGDPIPLIRRVKARNLTWAFAATHFRGSRWRLPHWGEMFPHSIIWDLFPSCILLLPSSYQKDHGALPRASIIQGFTIVLWWERSKMKSFWKYETTTLRLLVFIEWWWAGGGGGLSLALVHHIMEKFYPT